MKKLLPLFFLLTCLSCNTGDTQKDNESLSQPPTVSHDSIEAIIKRQNDLRDKIQEIKEKNRETYTIGSTESDVIRIQGQPTSVIGDAQNQMFFYGRDYVSFKNGKVSSYSNTDGTLKIIIKPTLSIENNSSNKETASKGETKYVYYTCYIKEFGEMVKYISKIYSIENYTDEKMWQIRDCLVEQMRFFKQTRDNVTILPESFDTYSTASAKKSNISGSQMPGQDFCNR